MVIQGKEKTLAFRKVTLLQALRMEIDSGLKMSSKMPSAYSIIKKEYNIRGSREYVYRVFFYKLIDEKILVAK
jgi:hypothetical protein|tara:strand:- start:359 stop:577 length:219 start_codon:yes stop_codon:yes gene_type:complete